MSDTSTTSTVLPWAGWVKPHGGTWQRVAEGRDHDEVWAGLIRHVMTERHVERLVLPSGVHPNERRRGRR